MVGITATVLQLIVKSGNIHIGLDAIAFGSLFTWAWQELFEGVNYFRRALGLLVLIGIIAPLVLQQLLSVPKLMSKSSLLEC